MRGASRGVREVEQPDRAGAENSAGFCFGRGQGVRALKPVCGARGIASQAESRGALATGRRHYDRREQHAAVGRGGTGETVIARFPSGPVQAGGAIRRRKAAKRARRREPRGCGAPQGVRLRQRRWRRKTPIQNCASRRSTSPHIAREGRIDYRRTRRRPKNTGADACSHFTVMAGLVPAVDVLDTE